MPVTFRWGLTLPLWAVVFCAVALSAPERARPLLMTFVGIGVIASTMPTILRRFGPVRTGVEVFAAADDGLLPGEVVITAGRRTRTLDAAIDARTMTAEDASDLVRMDDDGGWQMARQSALADGPVPRKNQRLL